MKHMEATALELLNQVIEARQEIARLKAELEHLTLINKGLYAYIAELEAPEWNLGLDADTYVRMRDSK